MSSLRTHLVLAASLVGLLASGSARGQTTAASSGGLFGEQRDQSAGQWRAARSTAVPPTSVRPTSYSDPVRVARVNRPRPNSYLKSSQVSSPRTMTIAEPAALGTVVEGEYLVDGEFSGGEVVHEGEMVYDGGGEAFAYDRPPHWMDNLWLFAGTTGFKGPIDQGQNGNFGFHEGVNYGIPLFYDRPLSAQVGVRFTQSDFSGSELSDETRHQMFFTAGVFRRVDHGWQLGAAFDWLKDDYYTELDVHQLRAELSWVSSCGNELGFMAALSTADDQPEDAGAAPDEFFEVNDQFAMFLRIPFDRGGDGRVFAGATSDRDGILGADVTVPINARWSLQAAATYLIPEESSNATADPPGHVGETWGLSIALVWYPGHCPVEGYNPFKPLFNVADNTSMLIDRRAD